MWRNYLTIAVRNLTRHKVYSAINIAGLSAGMACALLILLWVQDELSYDRFHEDANDLYRIVRRKHDKPPDRAGHIIPNVLAPVLARNFPEIAAYTRVHNYSEHRSCTLAYGDKRFYESEFFLADASFFEVLTFPFVEGDPKTALSSPHAVVLTEEMAEKYFGDEEPLGKVLGLNNERELTVTGVVTVPHNSHLQFDFVARIELLGAARLESWGWECSGYVRLQKDASLRELSRKIAATMKRSSQEHDHQFSVDLEPVTRIHLYRGRGDIHRVYIFSAIAVLVLLIACINYTNLTTARYSRSAREVGLRKVVGAHRTELIAQFFRESIFLSLLSALLATGVVELGLPVFNEVTGKELVFGFLHNGLLWGGLLCLSICVGVVSGIYPALFLSSFKPVSVLKGTLGMDKRGPSFRKVLVIVQFTISIVLIICAVIVRDQHAYMMNKALGFTQDHVVCIPINDELREGYEAYRSELLQNSDVLGVTFASSLPFDIYHYHFIDWEGKDTDNRAGLRFAVVDPDYIPTFEIVPGADHEEACVQLSL